jgi:CRISPR-associated protein Csy1
VSQIPDPPNPSEPIQNAILAFLQERLQTKLDKLKDGQDEERNKLLQQHQPENWIADAARKAKKVQMLVSHVLKYTHPDAKGSNLSSTGNPYAETFTVGTHSLGVQQAFDAVVSTAAYLPIPAFLEISVEGRTLLQRCIAQDPDLCAALPVSPEIAKEWMAAFDKVAQPEGRPISHTLAKQLYWPLEGGGYHLLSPLFPTSLTDMVWNIVRDDLFSDAAKSARDARKNKKQHSQGYREYPGMVLQKFGGDNQQNVSQRNAKRHGENYLFASLPPVWQSVSIRPPLRVESVFPRRFGARRTVRELTQVLKKFLESVAGVKPNKQIANKRAELVRYILDELLQFAAELHELDGGWSANEDCKLVNAERLWLDPKRAGTDASFAADWRRGDWQDEICLRFSQWLNASLRTDKLPMGQPEALEWQSVLDDELRMIRREF